MSSSKFTASLVLLWIAVFAFSVHGSPVIPPQGDSPRDGMLPGRWSTGNKQAFGTAYEAYDRDNKYSASSPTAPISRVWYTAARGVLTEVYWPTVDKAQLRDSEFLISDGQSFLLEERKNLRSTVHWIKQGVPAFVITNEDPSGRFSIERTLFSDPDRDVVLQHIRITRRIPGLSFYLLHNPSVANTAMGDNAYVSVEAAPGPGLFAWEGQQAQAVVFTIPLKQVSAGFEGTTDGYQDISKNFHMNYHYQYARNGNVTTTAWLDIPEDTSTVEFDMALAFAENYTDAYALGRASLDEGIQVALDKFTAQWEGYQSSVRDLSGQSTDGGALFRSSVAVLKSMEDKSFEGAFVASPTIPWGEHRQDQSVLLNGGGVSVGARPGVTNGGASTGTSRPLVSQAQTGGYHLVWPRDLYQMATTFIALDDPSSAIASLNHFKRVQYTARDGRWEYGFRSRSRDGSFAQNMWVTGEPYWNQLQMDQTAMPVVLAYKLWKAGYVRWQDYWDLVRRAADFIREFGPWTAQERWEENFGASPSTLAAEVAALWTAAEFADAAGDKDRAAQYRAMGDSWNSRPGDNIEAWAFTNAGVYGNGHYYERIEGSRFYDQIWDPNDNEIFEIRNGGGLRKEKEIIDGGFLELVRFGVRKALNPYIVETIPKYDQTIRVNTAKGIGFYRYIGDMYNYEDVGGKQTRGMLWPLLTGERGHYELSKALEQGLGAHAVDDAVTPYIHSIENFSTASQMIPEQVWDAGVGVGQGTGSATPLGWAHGEYVKLLRSRQQRMIYDRLPIVTRRAMALDKLEWSKIEKLTQPGEHR